MADLFQKDYLLITLILGYIPFAKQVISREGFLGHSRVRRYAIVSCNIKRTLAVGLHFS